MADELRRIFVNGRFLGRPATGVDRFAYELLREIDRQLAVDDPALAGTMWIVLVPPGTPTTQGFAHIQVRSGGRRRGHLWEQVELPRLAVGGMLVNLCNTAPALRRRQLVVIHDAATARVPESFGLRFRLLYRVLMPWLGRRAEIVATVSEFARRELEDVFRIPAGRVEIVPEGAEHVLRPPPDADVLARAGLGADRPFLLAVSSVAPHKNFRLVVEALAAGGEAPFDVAIAGGANARVFGETGPPPHPSVRWLGYVSDGELRALYEAAAGFVFPSLYEGFGLPPLEAMACGCPVIAARAGAVPEVCGDAALYVDPRDPAGLRAAMERLVVDVGLREELVRRGRERAELYTWDAAAQALSALLTRPA